MHDRVRGNHDELKQIASSFAHEAEATARTLAQIRRQKDVLQGGDWAGQAARKFYDEMDSSVLPALTRLQRALTQAQQVTQKISARLRQAEADAAAVLKDREAFNAQAAFAGASAGASGSTDGGGKGFWGQVGGVFKGIGLGAWDTVSGLWTAVTHPIDTIKGLGYAVTHPGELWDAIKKPYTEAWAKGDYGEAIGRGVFEIASLFFPPGGGAAAKGGAKAADVASDVARVANVASDVAKAAKVADKVADVSRVAKIGDHFGDAAEMARLVSRTPDLAPIVDNLVKGEQKAAAAWSTLSDIEKAQTIDAFSSARRALELPDAAETIKRFNSLDQTQHAGLVDNFGGALGSGATPPGLAGQTPTALGALKDTQPAFALGGERILNTQGWTPELNALWVRDAVERGEVFHLRTPVEADLGSLVSTEARFGYTTVYARELDTALQAGYTRVGDYLVPPALPTGRSAGSYAAQAGVVGAGTIVGRDEFTE